MPPSSSPIRTKKDVADYKTESEGDSTNGICFNSFEIVSILGQGSFGKVFHVKLKSTDEEFALKALK